VPDLPPSRAQAFRERLVLLRDGRPGPDAGIMLGVARQAWSGWPHALLTMPVPFLAGFLVMFEACVLAGGARSRGADLLARARGMDLPFYRTEPGTVLLICLMLLASLLAAAWVQAMLMRLAMRGALAQDEDWPAAMWPDRLFLTLLGTIALPQLCAVMPFVAVFLALASLHHVLGPISAWLSLPLLLAPAVVACVACLRASLAGAPAALGLAEPVAESWDITRGRLAPLSGALVIGMGPFVLLALVWPAVLQPVGFGIWQSLWTAAVAIPAFYVQGGITALLYERWRTALRPDMRPSRHRNRRREPLLN